MKAILLACVVLSVCLLLTSFLPSSRRLDADTFSAQELSQLRPGDVILRRGYGMVSDYIVSFLGERRAITHCGILLKKGNEWQVFHTESNQKYNGTILQKLEIYAKQSHPGSLVVVRPKGSVKQNELVLRQCEYQLKNPKPFDLGFNYLDSTNYYCAELLRNIYLEAYGEDLLPARKRITKEMEVLKMDNFLNPRYFEVVVE